MILALLFLLLALGIFAGSLAVHKDALSPWSLYGTSWCLLFGLSAFNLVAYTPVAMSTYALLIAANAAFAIGAFVGLGAPLRRRARPSRRLDPSVVDQRRFEILLLVMLTVGLIGFAAFLRAVNELFGVAVLTSDLGYFRSMQNTAEYTSRLFVIKFLLYLNWLTPSLTILYFVTFGRDSRRWPILVFLLSASTTLFSGERSSVVFILLTSFFTWYYAASTVKGRKTPGGLAALALMFCLSIGYYVGLGEIIGKSAENMVRHVGGLASPGAPHAVQTLVAPYVTLTANIPAFQAYIDMKQEQTWGAFTVLPIVKALAQLQIVTPQTVPSEVLAMMQVPFDFNTCTYLYVYYTDWGYTGVLLAPVGIGFVSCWLYLRMRVVPTIGLIVINAMVAHNLIMSVAVNRFVQTPFWMFLAMVPVMNRWVRVRWRLPVGTMPRLKSAIVGSDP